jgi:hypothetical protein
MYRNEKGAGISSFAECRNPLVTFTQSSKDNRGFQQ